MKAIITEEQCYTISSFLQTAASKFDEIAKSMREVAPPLAGFAQQFDKQAHEARQFATMFMNSTKAELEIPEE